MSPDATAALQVTSDPSHALLAGVTGLLDAAAGADGVPPLNEAALLALKHPHRGGTRHLVATAGPGGPDGTDGSGPLGYAQLAPDGTGQLIVAPDHRRQGVGSRLVTELLTHAAQQGIALRVWALGDSPAASALAARTGLTAARTLLIMTRPLAGLPAPVVPEGVAISTFRVGEDEEAWLRVNARAFAHHPEQGSIDAEDLAERLGEDWFDPAGFFLARPAVHPAGGSGGRPPVGPGFPSASEGNPPGGSGGRPPVGQVPLLGFHWTKQHEGRLGEVYVLGVDPDAQGRGLAKALLLTGLAHLRDRGDDVVELYVEADQPGPVGLYTAYGFTVASSDVMYSGPASQPPEPVHAG